MDYTQDEYLMGEIADAKDTRVGRDLLQKNATDLHILVKAQGDSRPISLGMEYPNFAALRNVQDADGMTPLMYAAEELKGDILLQLEGTQPGLRNKDGLTALDLFEEARNANPGDFPDDAEYLAKVRHVLGQRGGRRRKGGSESLVPGTRYSVLTGTQQLGVGLFLVPGSTLTVVENEGGWATVDALAATTPTGEPGVKVRTVLPQRSSLTFGVLGPQAEGHGEGAGRRKKTRARQPRKTKRRQTRRRK